MRMHVQTTAAAASCFDNAACDNVQQYFINLIIAFA